MNPLPLREPRKAQRNRDRGSWSPFMLRPRRRCPSPRHTYHQGTVIRSQQTSCTPDNTCQIGPFRARKAHLSDILVSHPADLLDVCGGLGDGLEGVAGQDEFVLLGLGDLDVDTRLHDDSADELLADKVAVQSEKSASKLPMLHWTADEGSWQLSKSLHRPFPPRLMPRLHAPQTVNWYLWRF
jgi:hypothetical protein